MSIRTAPTVITIELLRACPLPNWDDDAGKDDYGKLLLIAGSARLPGAAILAATAALRCGCGTVRVAAPQSVCVAIAVAVPELMMLPLPETTAGTIDHSAMAQLRGQYDRCDAAVIGPGLDDDSATGAAVRQIAIEIPLPLVIDAQALTALAAGTLPNRPDSLLPGERIYTPHAGEMAELMGMAPEAVENDRQAVTRGCATRHGGIALLKGRETLIADAAGNLLRNVTGTRGLGTAGSGDVLAGIIGSLLAQGLEVLPATLWGVYLHGRAGEAAARDLGDDGMIARDVIERLPAALRDAREERTQPHP